MYEHGCLEYIKKLCKSSGKCDDQQQYKEILETGILYTPKGFTDNIILWPI